MCRFFSDTHIPAYVKTRTFATRPGETELTSGRLNDIVKSHTKPQVQGGLFFSLGPDGAEHVQGYMG